MLSRKLRKRDVVALGDAPSLAALNQRIRRGQFPPPDLHDPVDGSALWLEETVAAHREREATLPLPPSVALFPKIGVAVRRTRAAARLAGDELADAPPPAQSRDGR